MKKRFALGIFDHSGVLSDDKQPVYAAAVLLMQQYEVTIQRYEEWLCSTNSSASEYFKLCGVDVPAVEIDKEYAKMLNIIKNRPVNPILPEMYPGAPEVLKDLRTKGLKLAIISNHPEKELLEELSRYGILGLFDKVSGDSSEKITRLREICDHFSISPSHAFFIEDTIYGLRAAKEAGVHSFGITTGYHTRSMLEKENIAIRVLDSLAQLLEHVE
ncbi:MAG TPA: HAD family hydrolase [Candidatus Nanoarchaeia archaeon]|nr:HAD family hydrolase [Candidatus Nanoarchaeia archaeon]